jgi:ribosome recycling factor
MSEKAKIAVRTIRKDSNNDIKDYEKEKDISEDESRRGQTEIQKITDSHVAQIDAILATKEADIMKV